MDKLEIRVNYIVFKLSLCHIEQKYDTYVLYLKKNE